jgi:hypothetical protein
LTKAKEIGAFGSLSSRTLIDSGAIWVTVETEIACLRQLIEAMKYEQQSIMSRLDLVRTTVQDAVTVLERLEGKVDSILRRTER